jgi:lysyl-tRNA synthetase class 1
MELLPLAGNWADEYSEGISLAEKMPDVSGLSDAQKKALASIADLLDKSWTDKDFAKQIFEAARSNDVKPGQLFKAIYTTLLGKPRGPRAAPFILSLDKDFAQKRLRLEG